MYVPKIINAYVLQSLYTLLSHPEQDVSDSVLVVKAPVENPTRKKTSVVW